MSDKSKILSHARLARDFVFDLLFPIACLGCGAADDWLCPACLRQIRLSDTLACHHCGRPTEHGDFCPHCRPDFVLSGVWVACDYNDPIVAALIKSFKYRLARDIKPVLGRLLANYMRSLLNRFTLTASSLDPGKIWRELNDYKRSPLLLLDWHRALLVPIPLHARRQRWRGFNQAALLADELQKYFNLEVNDKDLVRRRYSRPQAKLSQTKRLRNLSGAFAWRGPDLAGRHILLVDDVATTGTTLNECAKALKTANAGEVWALVMAHGQ